MQPSPQTTPSPSSQSFAGLLAAFASPANSASAGTRGWSDEVLKDDVVTLSYERALRAHARYRPANRNDGASEQSGAGLGDARETSPVTIAKPVTVSNFAQPGGVEARAAAQTAAELERRAASVTIRLSHAECARLRQRAAEAGLTVSAYLRSCVLEADALRAQVKQALAEMRAAGSTERKAAKAPARRSWIGCLARAFSRRKLVN